MIIRRMIQGPLISQYYELHANPGQISNLVYFFFLMGKFRVLWGLVHGIMSPVLIKSYMAGESPGFSDIGFEFLWVQHS